MMMMMVVVMMVVMMRVMMVRMNGDAYGDDDFQRLFFIVFRAEMGI